MTKMVNVKVNGKWNILMPEHRAARPEWHTKEGWERKRLDSMMKTTKKGDVVYYVGAEEGEMCALLQMYAGAELVMFEPNPAVWPNIKVVWNANALSLPLLSLPGFAGNFTDLRGTKDPGTGFPPCADGEVISDHGFKNLCEDNGMLPVIKIDDLVALTRVPPDMISIDVEGAEWEVLRGAEKTLREHSPRIYLSLHPEFLYEIYKEYSNDLRWWLKQMGYKETLLDYQHEVHLLYEAKK